jgi:hypothetical protein
LTVATSIKAVEVRAISAALERNQNNRLAAARDIGLHKSTLFRKIKVLGTDLPETDGRSRSKGELWSRVKQTLTTLKVASMQPCPFLSYLLFPE